MIGSKLRIDVSPEMVSLVGQGAVQHHDVPAGWAAFSFMVAADAPSMRFDWRPLGATMQDADLVLVVSPAACERVFGGLPTAPARWYLPGALRSTALAVRDCEGSGEAQHTLRLARSLELLCCTFRALQDGELIGMDDDGLSEIDATRIAKARRIIDERWHEKLTLDEIARASGLNRDKLSRGFRMLFRRSVADVLVENRLAGAHRMLLASDLPVSTVGYRCGYLNNASFTRAFSRRFGVAPSQLRQGRAAA